MKTVLFILSLFWVSVSHATIYYVSTTGSNSNNGTTTGTPWQTLTKVNSINFAAGDQILFKRGDTWTGDSLLITHSGSSGNPIIYGAYGTGNNPIISGFIPITAWTDQGSNIWQSTNAVSSLSNCNMLTIGGINLPMGRFPKVTAANTGYLTFQTHTGYTALSSTDLTGTPDWTGAEVVIRSNAYKIDRGTITSQFTDSINFTSVLNPMQNGSGFFLQADIRCCTQQNEWFYNTSTKKLSIYSVSQPSNINIATIEKLVYIQGNYVTFNNIIFIGANGCGIYAASNTYNNITVTYCSFINIGASAMYTSASYLDVENCSFSDCNNNSISTDAATNITIKNNTFQNIGIFQGMKDLRSYPLVNSNVEALQTSNYSFENNTVENVGYDGLNFYGSNVLVKNNFFTNFCAILNDGGAIYTYTGGRAAMTNVVITKNICVNSANTANGTSYSLASPGIYLDYASANVEISYNSIANTYRYGMYISSGGNVNIYGNNIYNATEYQLITFIDNNATTSNTDKIHSNKLVCKVKNPVDEPGNYWGFQKSLVYVAYTTNPDSSIHVAANDLDSNCYARPIADDKVIFIDISGPFDGKFKTIAEWKTWGSQDAHSYGSPQAITDTSQFKFIYNYSATANTFSLTYPMIDMNAVKYATSITLQPYMSAILIKDNNPFIPTYKKLVRYKGKTLKYKEKPVFFKSLTP